MRRIHRIRCDVEQFGGLRRLGQLDLDPSVVRPAGSPEQLVVDVTIKGGKVTPTNEQLQAKVGDPIVLRVESDAADQLHVHSNPEHTFAVEPKPGQSFQFTVTVPGKVDVELHELNRTIASIAVQ